MKWARSLAARLGKYKHPLLLLICLVPVGLGLHMNYNGQPVTEYYDYKTHQAKPLTASGLYWTSGLLLGLYGLVFLLNQAGPQRLGKSKAALRFGKRRRKK